MIQLVGDFETTTLENDCRVWASCLVDIEDSKIVNLCNNIDETMLVLKELTMIDSVELYYHNLKFDGEFILSWLYLNGFSYSDDLKKVNTFRTLIVDTGAFYTLEINFGRKHKPLKIKDSLKIIPLKVSQMAKAFGLDVLKGDIDYNVNREIGHVLTDEEIDYIVRDCKIVAKCLNKMFEQGLNKMTIASNAMNSYMKLIGGRGVFKKIFPILENDDKYFRQAYKGGYTYVNPKHQNKWINKEGCTYDVNSLYPSVMHSNSKCLLPYGIPVYFKGEYPKNELFPLYIITIKCNFKLKKGYVPTIQLKNNIRFGEQEYISDSGVERVELTLTNVDYETFLKHYDVSRIEFIDGYMFKGQLGLFDKYINYWIEQKIKAENEGNKGLRQISKLMLNSLYGRFAINVQTDTRVPIFGDDEVVSQKSKLSLIDENYDGLSEDKERELTYTPMACFITAYARRVTHLAIQENYDIFCYADTDSIHLNAPNAKNIDIHNTKLGAWKHECNWTKAKFIRAKTYIEVINGHLDVKCSGMPDNIKEIINEKNFKIGFTTEGLDLKYQKLIPKRVKGGVVLVPTTFSIK